jgi:hypothetical protein
MDSPFTFSSCGAATSLIAKRAPRRTKKLIWKRDREYCGCENCAGRQLIAPSSGRLFAGPFATQIAVLRLSRSPAGDVAVPFKTNSCGQPKTSPQPQRTQN